MTNQALIQAKIWKGYSQAALRLGASYQFYRPSGPSFPGNPTFNLPVSLNAEDMKYSKPNKYGKATWYALVDGTSLHVGDYFIGPQGSINPVPVSGSMSLSVSGPLSRRFGGAILSSLAGFWPAANTFFIAALQPLLPILVVECNRIVSIERVTTNSGIGAQPYSGITASNSSAYVSGVPCSILQGTKGEKSSVNLPGDTRNPWWNILMPRSVGNVKYGDLIIDDLGRRYVASSSELTDLGYRLTAMMAMT